MVIANSKCCSRVSYLLGSPTDVFDAYKVIRKESATGAWLWRLSSDLLG